MELRLHKIMIFEHWEDTSERFDVHPVCHPREETTEEEAKKIFEDLKNQFVVDNPEYFPDGEGTDFYYESDQTLAFPDDPEYPGPVTSFTWDGKDGVQFHFNNGSEKYRIIVQRSTLVIAS